jgi:hypothetical protein
LLEAACDLLWSLAFNNPLLKEVIGQQGCIPVVLRGMRQHPTVADFLKSSCGALSNLCQNPHNQSLIAQHGGVMCMLQVGKTASPHLRQGGYVLLLIPFFPNKRARAFLRPRTSNSGVRWLCVALPLARLYLMLH